MQVKCCGETEKGKRILFGKCLYYAKTGEW